jgi:hypothetical protein
VVRSNERVLVRLHLTRPTAAIFQTLVVRFDLSNDFVISRFLAQKVFKASDAADSLLKNENGAISGPKIEFNGSHLDRAE